MYGSPPVSKDLNIQFPPAARLKDSDHQQLHQQQQQQMSSGLLRYRSAPSTLLGEVCEDFLPARPSSPETETMFARYLVPDLRNEIREKPSERSLLFSPPAASVEHRVAGEEVTTQQNGRTFSASQMLYHCQQQMPSHSSLNKSYQVAGSMAMEAEQIKTGGGGNCSNLIRHSSSPAGLFTHLNVENGYPVMRGMGELRNGNGSMGDGVMAGCRLKGQISFSSRQASSAGTMSQISEMGGSSPEESSLGSGSTGGRCYIPRFPIGSWDESSLLSDSFSGLKRARDVDGKLVAGLNQSEPQNGELRNNVSGLSSSDMATIEKLLHFQDSVPCKIRAKRGCATHPRSIAERVRRTRISERMRKLQELVPNMDKQTNTADMLDLAVEYIKDLQRQAKTLSDSKARCTCSSSKQKSYSNPAV